MQRGLGDRRHLDSVVNNLYPADHLRRPVSPQWNQRFAKLEELPLSNQQGTCRVRLIGSQARFQEGRNSRSQGAYSL